MSRRSNFDAKVDLPHVEIDGRRLLQLGFWWDSTHLATVDHYVNFVLKQPSVKRGTFPEDTLGREMLDAIKAGGLKAAEPYAAYLWVEDEKGDNEECRVVGHLNGRHWRQFPGGADNGCGRQLV